MGNMRAWRTSSYSAGNGACVEVAGWRKSTHSGGSECVEVGSAGTVVGVRDSRLEGSPVLAFPAAAWQAFTADLKDAR